MASQAKIKINGVIGSDTNLPINTLVQLDNDGLGGETTYLWSILDQPPGAADSLSSTTISNPTFTPKKEGTYLIRLVVDQSLPTEDSDQAVAAVLQLKTLERVPAAGETTEADATDGWAVAANSFLRRLDSVLSDPGIVVGANGSGSTRTRGDVLRVTSEYYIKTGLPGQEIVPGFTLATADAYNNVNELLCVLEGGVDGSTTVAPNGLLRARWLGAINLQIGSGSVVGDPVYVTDSGTISNTPGTINRQCGSVTSVGGGGYRGIWFDGTGSSLLTPIDAPYVVYGSPGTLTNANRIDGTNATGASGAVPYTFRAADVSTIAAVFKRFSDVGADIVQIQTETGTVLGEIRADGTVFINAGNATNVGLEVTAVLGAASAIKGNGYTSGYGVQGTGGATGKGVIGYGGANSGTGVYGEAKGTNSRGVEGKGTGYGEGVYGVGGTHASASGVYGISTNGYGVRGNGTGTTGVGVEGMGTTVGVIGYGATGNARGVEGAGTGSGAGVHGEGHAGTGRGVEGYGSTTGDGVFGKGGGTGGAVGVRGEGSDAGGYGVYGLGIGTYPGVQGQGGNSAGGTGVKGQGGTGGGYGVHGIGTIGYAGVYGKGDTTGTGVYGAGGDTAGATGVYGLGGANGGRGVYGVGVGGSPGVQGEGDPDSDAIGVAGYGGGTAVGIYGKGGDTTTATGVEGVGGDNGGHGVVGTGKGTGSYGVYGKHTNGRGIVAESDTTSPGYAAFRIVPQDTAPTTASIGDMYVSTSGVLYICTVAGVPALPPTWTVVGSQT